MPASLSWPETWLCAVRRAAALGIAERGLRYMDAANDHAVVQQGQHHGQQGAFWPPQRRCAGKYGGRFADEFCAEPKGNGAVNKVFHRGGHIAETGRAAERKAGAVFEVVGSRVWRTFVREWLFNGFANGGNFGNGTQYGFANRPRFRIPRAIWRARLRVLPFWGIKRTRIFRDLGSFGVFR